MSQRHPEIRSPADLHARESCGSHTDDGIGLTVERDRLPVHRDRPQPIAPERLGDHHSGRRRRHVVSAHEGSPRTKRHAERGEEISRDNLPFDGHGAVRPGNRRRH